MPTSRALPPPRASLLAVDLDNTLINRDAAFRRAASAFLSENGLPECDADVIMELDQGGHAPRPAVAAALAQRWNGISEHTILTFLRRGPAAHVTLDDAVRRSLLAVRAAGVPCVIVTNGRGDQQEEKIRNAGLDALVDGWVISGSVGHRKPSPEIFHAAAEVVGLPGLDRATTWMIGDAAHADVQGAVDLGIHSIWVSGGRPWTESSYWPTLIATDVVEAIAHVLGERPRLVRDRIPSWLLETDGRQPEVYEAAPAEYRARLREALREEVTVLLAENPAGAAAGQQLAEILEVVHAVATDLGISPEVLQELRRGRAEAQGTYESRTIWTGRYAERGPDRP
ncbi:HAD superfamily hydrolase (TIGR01549 family) [Streptomyces sp. 3211.6]|uniref:HAD-IA family hydrolase n=1 Tax=Streptomyces sp. 3211.6 TaxID=1938845 RepID=UPI000F153A24|nr:HAD-IA family hydrolase [Streptomyces sp. 3211.6]RKT08155.1 HAD superfamily hydrolase (TIGR01549 family) [Streptomyces sp. 3211.6]